MLLQQPVAALCAAARRYVRMYVVLYVVEIYMHVMMCQQTDGS